jgi:rRNA 2'-O-methyltransferase fibrillarin
LVDQLFDRSPEMRGSGNRGSPRGGGSRGGSHFDRGGGRGGRDDSRPHFDRGRGGGDSRPHFDRGGSRGGRDDSRPRFDRGGARGGRDDSRPRFDRDDSRPRFDRGRGKDDFRKDRRGGRSDSKKPGLSSRKPTVQPHPQFPGVFLCPQKSNTLLTQNYTPGKSVYGEKLVQIGQSDAQIEYRVWNPYRSKIGASITCGFTNFGIKPGSSVLYLGAASGTTVSHVSDIVSQNGRVYAIEFSPRVGRELLNLSKLRENIVPIIEDARHPLKYRMLVPMVDCLFADVAQPDQTRIFAVNAEFFLRSGGYFMISIKAGCIDSSAEPAEIFAMAADELAASGFRVEEQIDVQEYHGGHAVLIGTYRPE